MTAHKKVLPDQHCVYQSDFHHPIASVTRFSSRLKTREDVLGGMAIVTLAWVAVLLMRIAVAH